MTTPTQFHLRQILKFLTSTCFFIYLRLVLCMRVTQTQTPPPILRPATVPTRNTATDVTLYHPQSYCCPQLLHTRSGDRRHHHHQIQTPGVHEGRQYEFSGHGDRTPPVVGPCFHHVINIARHQRHTSDIRRHHQDFRYLYPPQHQTKCHNRFCQISPTVSRK